MTALAILQINGRTSESTGKSLEKDLRRWTAALFVFVVLAVVSGLGGLAIGVLSLSGLIGAGTSVSTLGTILIGVSFPNFFLAAHCLDKAEAARKAIRLEYCRQHGLQEETR